MTTPPHRATAASLHAHFTHLSSSGALTTHLSDSNSIAILTTPASASPSGLSSLSAAFVQAHDTASRMGLGQPLRVTLATRGGAAVIQTVTMAGEEDGEEGMLVGTVVAAAERLAEARMASWGVEEVARRFQKSAGEG